MTPPISFQLTFGSRVVRALERHDRLLTPARYMVMGTAAGWRDSLRVDVRLVNVEIEETIRQLTVHGRIRDLGSLADSAARVLRVALEAAARRPQ